MSTVNYQALSRVVLDASHVINLIEEGQDDPWFIGEMNHLRGELGLAEDRWSYVLVGHTSLDRVMSELSQIPNALVLNHCDSGIDDKIPAERVARSLESHGIRFIGGSSRFTHDTGSKVGMKRAFLKAGVPTAPWIEDPNTMEIHGSTDSSLTAESMFPLFLKTDRGSGSTGLSDLSVVHDQASLLSRWQALEQAWHYGCIAESFIEGPEFSVLVSGAPQLADTVVRAYPAMQRQFPSNTHFKTEDQYYVPKYVHCLAPADLQPVLQQLAVDAYLAVGGDSCGRVDLRQDTKTGRMLVLEVNSYPSYGELDVQTISLAAILHFANSSLADLILRLVPRSIPPRPALPPSASSTTAAAAASGLDPATGLPPGVTAISSTPPSLAQALMAADDSITSAAC